MFKLDFNVRNSQYSSPRYSEILLDVFFFGPCPTLLILMNPEAQLMFNKVIIWFFKI